MRLEHRFTVPLGPAEAYRTLLDLETVAACFPGAQLEEVTGDVFQGRVKVKLGPVSVLYRGQGTFVERDDDARRVVIEARGRDNRGSSTAAATVTASVHADGDGSEVRVLTDLDVTGPPAQLAGGAMEGVSNRLLDRFVANLRNHVTGDGGVRAGSTPAASSDAPAPAAAPMHAPASAPSGARRAPDDDDQLDLFATVLGDEAGKLLGVGIVAFVLGVLVRSLVRRRPTQVVITDERRRRA